MYEVRISQARWRNTGKPYQGLICVRPAQINAIKDDFLEVNGLIYPDGSAFAIASANSDEASRMRRFTWCEGFDDAYKEGSALADGNLGLDIFGSGNGCYVRSEWELEKVLKNTIFESHFGTVNKVLNGLTKDSPSAPSPFAPKQDQAQNNKQKSEDYQSWGAWS